VTDHTFPTQEQLAAYSAPAGTDEDAPVVMLNLNHYREVAEYEDGRSADGLSGREVYLRYGVVAQQALDAVGGRILWATEATTPLIGCDHDTFHEVLAVWYPNRAAFVALTEYPGYVEALAHRAAALDRAALIPCVAGAEPKLGTPFDA
jgi:uncharacterized protein (DUF1330 family)